MGSSFILVWVFWKTVPGQARPGPAWMSLRTWREESDDQRSSSRLPRRRSRCGGKGTWCGRACPTRPPSPHRGLRAPLPRRALWSKRPRRRAARGRGRQASNIWAKQLFSPAGMQKGGCRAVTACELKRCAWGSRSSFRQLVFFSFCLSSFLSNQICFTGLESFVSFFFFFWYDL